MRDLVVAQAKTEAPAAGPRQGRGAEKGSAYIVALALVLGLMVLVVATQTQVVSQLKLSKSERDYERALQMAEAGANAYLNRVLWESGGAAANANLIPPAYALGSVLSLNDFKTQAKNGTIPAANLIYYPAGQTKQGYFAALLSAAGNYVDILGYGWSNGVVRRVRVHAFNSSMFDWAAIWGINPGTTQQDYAWKFSGNVSIIGGCGADGRLSIGQNGSVAIYDGPLVWAGNSRAKFGNPLPGDPSPNPIPAIYTSGVNNPSGHLHTGHTAADPPYRVFRRPLGFPTADTYADLFSGASGGVGFFKTNNNNATGIRIVARNKTTGELRELNQKAGDPTSYASLIIQSGSYKLDVGRYDENSILSHTDYDKNVENVEGLRIHPGNYYFEEVEMSPSDTLYLRTMTDTELTDPAIPKDKVITSATGANPNPGKSNERNVRFFIGSKSSGSDPNSTFTYKTYMEYTEFSSRFRVYSRSRGMMVIKGTNSNPPPPFRVSVLAYSQHGSQYYGNVQFQSSVYMYGSLIAWSVDSVGGCTIERQVNELSPEDRALFVLDWMELP